MHSKNSPVDSICKERTILYSSNIDVIIRERTKKARENSDFSSGGPPGARTLDNTIKSRVLYQLS